MAEALLRQQIESLTYFPKDLVCVCVCEREREREISTDTVCAVRHLIRVSRKWTAKQLTGYKTRKCDFKIGEAQSHTCTHTHTLDAVANG
jgi:hypothetical protein